MAAKGTQAARVTLAVRAAAALVAAALAAAGTVVAAAPAGATLAAGSDWLGEVNAYRSASGLAPVSENTTWEQGLANHLTYLADTPTSYFTGSYQSAHTENPASPYYTSSGAQEAGSSDLVQGAVGSTPAQLIDGWLTAPFHAIGILRHGLSEVAFSSDPSTGDAGLNVLSGLDSSQSPPPSPILFPGNGPGSDLWAFTGESPDPLESCGWSGQIVGLPLIAMLPATPAAGLTATLSGPAGTATSAAGSLCVVDAATYRSSDQVYGPNGKAILQGDNAVLLIPHAPLTFGHYSAEIDQPGAQPLSWSFDETQPEVLTVQAGDGQHTLTGHPFASPVSVTVGNGASYPTPGVPVSFTVSGPGRFPSGTTATVTADSNATATSPPITTTGPGTVTVAAAAAGAAPVSATLHSDTPRPVCNSTLPPGAVVGMAVTADGGGYWLADRFGQVAACGDAPFLGDSPSAADPVVAIAAAPDGGGYWLATAGGAVQAYGTAAFHGSAAGTHLASPIVGMATDPSTGGYWLLGGDGGVFAFDAPFLGSTGNIHLNRPAVGMTSSPSGNGYWFVADDGGVFAYGDAGFHGSTGNIALNRPVVGLAVDPSTGGYWLDASDGGIFAFDAPFLGSTGDLRLAAPCVSMTGMPDGAGYRFVAADGGVFDFGDAPFEGSAAG